MELDLELKIGMEGLNLMQEVRRITDIEELRRIRQALKSVTSLDDLRRIIIAKPQDSNSTPG
jgi:hypothetical protein